MIILEEEKDTKNAQFLREKEKLPCNQAEGKVMYRKTFAVPWKKVATLPQHDSNYV